MTVLEVENTINHPLSKKVLTSALKCIYYNDYSGLKILDSFYSIWIVRSILYRLSNPLDLLLDCTVWSAKP